MRHLVLITLAAVTLATIQASAKRRARPARMISLSQLQARGLAGLLNVKLGTIVTVEGVIAPNRSRAKAASDILFFVQIERVNGKALRSPVKYPFLVAHAWARVPTPRVGDRVTYVGFETGAFVGSPPGEFKHVSAYTTTAYHFETSFRILAVKKK